MPGPVDHRSASPIIKLIRIIGRGRLYKQANRFADEQAKRTQPSPNVPGGPYHKTSQIYYYTHDARREVCPPLLISKSKQIGTEDEHPAKIEHASPGKIYKWD